MKKAVLIGAILALSMQVMGATRVQDLLKKAREDYYKEEALKVKKEKAQSRGKNTSTGEVMKTDGEYPMMHEEEKPKPRTPMERLESNIEKANIRADYYERVVRSVAREETELKEYNEMIGNKKTKYKKVPKVKGLGK